MLKEYPLEETLLDGFEYPVAVMVEVTKQGIVLSKMRYLKAVGDVINQTIRCASIAMYAHVSHFVDPHLQDQKIGPVGIDLVYNFQVDKALFNETIESIKRGRGTINHNNPQTRDMAIALMEKIRKKERINYKRLSAQEQGLVLEPYVYHLFSRVGSGRRKVLQNIELIDREGLLKCQVKNDVIRYKPAPAPTMELDILMFTDLTTLPSILKGLESHGFRREL